MARAVLKQELKGVFLTAAMVPQIAMILRLEPVVLVVLAFCPGPSLTITKSLENA